MALSARADDGWERNLVTLNFDNDLTVRIDRHYTSGARLSYWSSDDLVPPWLRCVADAIPAWGFENAAQKWGLQIGQEIYTPDDLRAAALQPDDRPYAGWLYLGAGLRRRGPRPGPTGVMETVRLDLGVVGPPSLAENAQDWFHLNDPQGWSNQLSTEVAFALRYERRYRLAWRTQQQTWGVDLLPQFNVNLGTLDVSLAAGGLARFGYQIPNEFGTGRSPERFGAYAFVGAQGAAVIHNLFLDGNTFTDSHSVDKESWVGDFKAGLTFALKPLEIVLAHTFLSPEFNTQKQWDQFSSIFVTVKF